MTPFVVKDKIVWFLVDIATKRNSHFPLCRLYTSDRNDLIVTAPASLLRKSIIGKQG
jgi:hypothetical protein